jgi:ElaB/YqjD/DUF883 family membrane-anchored ribosome-binding protein
VEQNDRTRTDDSDNTAEGRFDRAREYVGDASRAVKEGYDSASEKVRNQYSAVKEKMSDVDYGEALGQARDYVRANPGKALLLSVGVGFLIGLLLRREDDYDE